MALTALDKLIRDARWTLRAVNAAAPPLITNAAFRIRRALRTTRTIDPADLQLCARYVLDVHPAECGFAAYFAARRIERAMPLVRHEIASISSRFRATA